MSEVVVLKGLNRNPRPRPVFLQIEQVEIPEVLSGRWVDDYDIVAADRQVRQRLQLLAKREVKRVEQLISVEQEAIKSHQTPEQRAMSLNRLVLAYGEQKNNPYCTKLAKYVSESEPIVKEYIALGKRLVFDNSFSQPGVEEALIDTEDAAKVESRVTLIERYLELASEYIQVKVTRVMMEDTRCPQCSLEIGDCETDESTGLKYCVCGCEISTVQIKAVKVGSVRDEQADRITFEKHWDRKCGTDNVYFSSALITALDEHFRSVGMPTGEEISAMPLNPDGTRGPYKKSVLMAALKCTHFPAHYKDIDSLCVHYWAWQLQDPTHLKARVMANYDITQKVYHQIKGDRSSSLNNGFLLYAHLRAVDYPIDPEDIKMPATPEIIGFCKTMWFEMCARTGVKYNLQL